MTEPDLDQTLARLLSATRSGTEPDANARARVRSALAGGLANASPAQAGLSAGSALRAKLWLLSALVIAALVGVAVLGSLTKPAPAPRRGSNAPSPAEASPAAPAAPAAPAPVPVPVPAPPLSTAPETVVRSPDSSAAAGPLVSASRGFARAEEPSDELGLVSSMQLALRSGNAARALGLANEHARRFPNGALSQEREGARTIARCQLAEPEARAAIQRAFDARYASSPYAARVKAACAR